MTKYVGPKTDPANVATQGDVTGGGSSTPSGVIVPFAGSTAPTGYLVCDGAAVSRTTYADLFAAIGTTYGAGDGSTTFLLPNLKGRAIVGVDAGQSEFDALGETGGAKTHTLTSSEIPSHTHSDGTLATDTAAAHSHSDGTLATDTAAAHTHSDGTLATDTAAAHSHGTGTLATNTTGSHSHASLVDANGDAVDVVSNVALNFSTLNNVANTGATTGVVRNLSNAQTKYSAGSTGSGGSHSHTLSGSTGDGGSHSHDVTGSTGSGGSHSHDVTGSTGSAGAHAHDVSGSTGSTGGGGAHNNLPPYIALSYLIKT